MKKYILSLDQGTTSSRAIVFDKNNNIVAKAMQEFKQIYPMSGWVEHDPMDILGSTVGTIAEVLVRAGITGDDIEAIGITNQRETVVVWDRETGVPLCNAIVWQCRRTADFCDDLKNKGLSKEIYDKTGLVIDAYFSASKIKWILDNVKGARSKSLNGKLACGTIDTFLMWHLSKGKIFATDYTNASRTMLFNINTLDWDDELLRLFNIPRYMLPKVYPSSYFYGVTDKTIAGADIALCGVAGDQQAALFGQLCIDKGSMKNTYGTGCFMLMNTGEDLIKSNNGLISTVAASIGKVNYALEGSIFVGGAVVQWLRDELKIIREASETEDLAEKVCDTNGVYIVPAFVGLGAPYWDPYARGTITGITRGTKREHIVRASLESIAYQVYDVVKAMEDDSGIKVKSLSVDGGASVNNFLMQFQADILRADVVRPKVVETSALGVCFLAGLKTGYFPDIRQLKRNFMLDVTFASEMDRAHREELLEGWKKSVSMTMKKGLS